MRTALRVRVDVVTFVLLAGAAACVEPFGGSAVQLDFGGGVQTNTRPGGVPAADQPPENTHYELYAVDAIYKTNADGTPILDGNGDPVIDRTYLFKVREFEIRPVVEASSPCFIELEDTQFPGLHVTKVAEAVQAATGITDPFAPNQDPDDVVDVLTAQRRVRNIGLVEDSLKAVTSHANFRYPAPGTACVGQAGSDPQLIPPANCTDAASNAQRLALCKALWAANPDYYEGSDKVFTLPLSGSFLGMVDGMSPVNGGFVGGAGFFAEANLVGFDAYLVNWQYDDLDHDGRADFPASVPLDQRSETGFPYLRGEPRSIVRGVVTVPLNHATNPRIDARLVIFPNLGDDDVHF